MKAIEAREISNGSLRGASVLFKLGLAWCCGKLNKKIETRARLGDYYTFIDNINEERAKAYFPIMKKCYEEDGYMVCYTISYAYFNRFVVIWDYDRSDAYFRKKYKTYDYYTPFKEE